MNDNDSRGTAAATSGGCGIGFILFIVFLILKLTHVIDWSWFWVVFPLWIGPATVLAISLLVFIVVFFISLFDNKHKRKH